VAVTGSMEPRRLNSRLICGVTALSGRGVNLELVVRAGRCAAIAGIGNAAIEHLADDASHLRMTRAKRVSSFPKVAGQLLSALVTNWPLAECLFTVVEDAHPLTRTLWGLVRLALADALYLRLCREFRPCVRAGGAPFPARFLARNSGRTNSSRKPHSDYVPLDFRV